MAKDPKFNYKREYRKVSIRTTDGSTLSGKVNIGIKERVSELFTKGEDPFVVLFDAEDKDSQGGCSSSTKATLCGLNQRNSNAEPDPLPIIKVLGEMHSWFGREDSTCRSMEKT